ncbi:MAG: hypothetical protein WCJ19_03195 [bacterium]
MYNIKKFFLSSFIVLLVISAIVICILTFIDGIDVNRQKIIISLLIILYFYGTALVPALIYSKNNYNIVLGFGSACVSFFGIMISLTSVVGDFVLNSEVYKLSIITAVLSFILVLLSIFMKYLNSSKIQKYISYASISLLLILYVLISAVVFGEASGVSLLVKITEALMIIIGTNTILLPLIDKMKEK